MEIFVGVLTLTGLYFAVNWFKSDNEDIEPKVVLLGIVLAVISYLSAFILPDLFQNIYKIQKENSEVLESISKKYDDLQLSENSWSEKGIYHSNLASLTRSQENVYFLLEGVEELEAKKEMIYKSKKFIYPQVYMLNVKNPIFREAVGECALQDYDSQIDSLDKFYSQIVNLSVENINNKEKLDYFLNVYATYLYVCYMMNEIDSKGNNEDVVAGFNEKNIELN